MIKANEIRVGNYVNYHDDDIVFQVTEISNLGIGVKNDTEETWIEYDRFSPIKLTTEILDKINWGGYIKFNIGSYFKIDDVGHLYYRSDYSGVNIDYLHQLQNFYYLLRGVELEIVW